jgi:SAM-dependent methyltransferase
MVLRSKAIYGLTLKYKYGANRLSDSLNAPFPNGVLQSRAELEEATRRGKELHLPLHRAPEKNWDHLTAVRPIAGAFPRSAVVLDAGAEFYSNVLPALFVCGFEHLYGMNLSFTDSARRGPIRYLPGDITRTGFPDAFFDAVTCMSVVEHGVPLRAYFQEMFRLLKPGGLLITSTDYYAEPIKTDNYLAHGAPVKIFSRQEAEDMLTLALESGFEFTGPVNLNCTERPIRWEIYKLEYTFLIFTLRKPAHPSERELLA